MTGAAAGKYPGKNAHSKNASDSDSGAGLARAMSPEGAVSPAGDPIFSNPKQYGRLGVFSRGWSSTVFKAEKMTGLAFILCDAESAFLLGVGFTAAPSPEGPWSDIAYPAF